ncbi:hypothetical protein Tco_0777049, partial [Tanacetum coccineum]
ILATQKEAMDKSAGLKKGLDEMIEQRSDGNLYYLDRIWVPLKGDIRTLIMDEAYKLKYSVHPGADKMYYNLRDSYHSSVRCAPFEALYSRKCHLPIMWAEVGEGQLIGPELVQETTEKISQIKDRLKVVRDHQKSYADKRRKPLEFSVGELRLASRCRIRKVVTLDEIQVDAKLNFVEEPMEISEREFKKLKRSRIAIVKVRWNSKRGHEFTWEREDQIKLKYPHLFSDVSS